MRISPINSYTNFKGSVYYKNQEKAKKELEKLADSEVGFLAPAVNYGLNACMDTIGKMTISGFECSLDIKFHKDGIFSPNYYLGVTASCPDETNEDSKKPNIMQRCKNVRKQDIKRKYKIDLPRANYQGISAAEIISRTLLEMTKDLVLDGNPEEDSFETILEYRYNPNKTMTQVIYEKLD